MNTANRLISEFHEEGYDEQVTMTYSDTEPIVLFRGLSYLLISSFDNELQMNLNFGGKLLLPHVIRSWGNSLILIPRFYRLDSGRYPGKNMYLDIREYLSLSLYRVLVFPKTDLLYLWNKLNYESSELDQIHMVSQSELTQIWMISSGYQPNEFISPFNIDRYAKELLSHVIAEDSSLELSIKQVISMLTNSIVSIELSPVTARVDHFHLVYLLHDDNSITEWKAMAIDGTNIYMVMGEYLLGICLQ